MTTSWEKKCGLVAFPHTPCFVIKLYINKKSFSLLLVKGSIFGLHLAAFVHIAYFVHFCFSKCVGCLCGNAYMLLVTLVV